MHPFITADCLLYFTPSEPLTTKQTRFIIVSMIFVDAQLSDQ